MARKLKVCMRVKKSRAFVSPRGERYSSGYAVVNGFGTKFHISKTKSEALKIAKKGNRKIKGC